MELSPPLVNHNAPSGPAVILPGPSIPEPAYRDVTPAVVMRPMELSPLVNHSAPSGPAVIPPGRHEPPVEAVTPSGGVCSPMRGVSDMVTPPEPASTEAPATTEPEAISARAAGRTSVREADSRCCATSNDRSFRIDRDRLGGRDAGAAVAAGVCAALATSRPATAPATLREGADWPIIPPQPVPSATIRPRSGDPGWVECTAAEDSLSMGKEKRYGLAGRSPRRSSGTRLAFRINLAQDISRIAGGLSEHHCKPWVVIVAA